MMFGDQGISYAAPVTIAILSWSRVPVGVAIFCKWHGLGEEPDSVVSMESKPRRKIWPAMRYASYR